MGRRYYTHNAMKSHTPGWATHKQDNKHIAEVRPKEGEF